MINYHSQKYNYELLLDDENGSLGTELHHAVRRAFEGLKDAGTMHEHSLNVYRFVSGFRENESPWFADKPLVELDCSTGTRVMIAKIMIKSRFGKMIGVLTIRPRVNETTD